jgi:hypothetical protein
VNYQETFHTALQSAWIIIKLVIPIYIIADILYYYNVLEKAAFLFKPFTGLLGLPAEAALSLISGIFLNLYAAVAFAAPLEMTPHQWSVLAIFLGVCHSLIVENVIMKKMGISNLYSYALRFGGGLAIAWIAHQMPSEWFSATVTTETFTQKHYGCFTDLITTSLASAGVLTAKIVILISVLIVIMDGIKSLPLVKNSAKNVSKGFTITVGLILGITYGAGVLIKEHQSGALSRSDVFFIGTFLMIAHAMIEDPLLFAIFGADLTMVIAIRLVAAVGISWLFWVICKRREIAS